MLIYQKRCKCLKLPESKCVSVFDEELALLLEEVFLALIEFPDICEINLQITQQIRWAEANDYIGLIIMKDTLKSLPVLTLFLVKKSSVQYLMWKKLSLNWFEILISYFFGHFSSFFVLHLQLIFQYLCRSIYSEIYCALKRFNEH